MHVVNPMDLANLLNGAGVKVEGDRKVPVSSTPPARYNSSYIAPILAHRPARDSRTLPSPPVSPAEPPPEYQQIYLPRPSLAYGLPHSPPFESRELAVAHYQERQPRESFSASSSGYGQHHQITLPSISYLNSPMYLPTDSSVSNRLHFELNYRSAHQSHSRSPAPRHSLRSRNERYSHATRRSPETDLRYSRSVIRKDGKPKQRGTPSNVKYTEEQVDFCRYFKEDLEMKWDNVLEEFQVRFPTENRGTNQCLTSRYYRDNALPALDIHWRPIEEGGKIKKTSAKVRDRSAERFKGAPHKLVEKHPRRALKYSWVTPEDKEKALAILAQDEREERMSCLSDAGNWRKAIREAEYREKK